MTRTHIDKTTTQADAESIWNRRRREPHVLSCCFLLHAEEQETPKTVYPEEWRVYTVYHA